MHKCKSYDPDQLNLLPFYYFTFKCDLDLQPTTKNVSHSIVSPQGEQLCQIILKSMYKYRSYDPDKLNLLSTPMGVDYVVFGFDMEVQPLVTHNAA